MNNEDKRTKQIRFEFRCITIPYTVLLLSDTDELRNQLDMIQFT